MSQRDQRPELSLVSLPSEHREIILRHGSSVVLFDHQSQQITLTNASDDPLNVCPACRRPLRDSSDEAHWTSETFMSPDYFNLLHRSHDVSVASSRSPSPSRLLRSQESTPSRQPLATEDVAEDRRTRASSRISSDAFSQGYFKKHFIEVRELGRGGSGVVLLVKHVIQGNEIGLLALKRIPVGDDVAWLEKVLREVQLLQSLTHSNLVSYKHVWLEYFQPTAFTPRVPHAFILQQYCNRGDLQSYIFGAEFAQEHAVKRRGSWRIFSRQSQSTVGEYEGRQLQPEEVFGFFKDIASGLAYLHKSGFVHRDLKPSNCLLDDSHGKLRCLVSDFGETTAENATRRSTGGTGTVSYCAPEVLRSDPSSGELGNFTQKSDIFSLGLILYLMCFGRLPYSNANPFDETTEDIDKLREEIATWAGISDERSSHSSLPEVLSGSLGRLLSLDPSDRPSSAEVLQGLKSFGLRARGRSNAGVEPETWLRHPSDTTGSPDSRPSPARRTQSGGGRSVSQYKAPAVDSEDPRSPPLSPVDSKNSHLPLPIPAETSLVQRARAKPIPSPTRPQMLLPAPPPRARTWTDVIIRSHTAGALGKLCIFCGKLWSLFAPCQPRSPLPITAYSLLLLAAIDLLDLFSSHWTSLMLTLLHVGILQFVSKYDMLCRNMYNEG